MLKLDQKGQTLPIVLGVTALILANTYYFMAIDKNTAAKNKLTATQVNVQTEQSRISSFLSDINICGRTLTSTTGTGNFYNRNITTLTDTVAGIPFDLVASNGQPFLKKDYRYAGRSQKVLKYYLKSDDAIANVASSYSLVVEYEMVNPNDKEPYSPATDFVSKSPKKFTVTRVPLTLQIDASNLIVNCFARPTTTADDKSGGGFSTLERAVMDSCKNAAPVGGLPNTDGAFFDNTTSIYGCFHRITPITCPIGQVINSAEVTAPTSPPSAAGAESTQQFTCLALSSACATTPIQAVVTGVTNSVVTCGIPKNGSCGAGQMMIKNGASIACATNCPTDQMFHSITAGGVPTCYNRTNLCPTGMFAKSVDASGTPSCEYIKYRNVDCGDSNYATNLDPVNGLSCAYYNRAKNCAGTWNYVSTFSAVATSCRNINY